MNTKRNWILTLGLTLTLIGFSYGADKKYPLDTCIVSGNKLGSMGKEITKVYDGQEVKFCCKPCIKKFEKQPDKYLPKLK